MPRTVAAGIRRRPPSHPSHPSHPSGPVRPTRPPAGVCRAAGAMTPGFPWRPRRAGPEAQDGAMTHASSGAPFGARRPGPGPAAVAGRPPTPTAPDVLGVPVLPPARVVAAGNRLRSAVAGLAARMAPPPVRILEGVFGLLD